MPLNRPLIVIVMAAASVALAGCQQGRVIEELPVPTLIEHSARARRLRVVKLPPSVTRPPVTPRREGALPAGWVPAVAARQWKWIVLHHSATDSGSARVFDKMHRAKGWDELGYHFVIDNGKGGPAGRVEVGGRWAKQKWGAHCKVPGNAYNERGIGICLVGEFGDRLPSAAQRASLRRLVEFLTDRYGIAPANVIGHREAPGTNTQCPGNVMQRYVGLTLRPHLRQRSRLARAR